MRVVVTGSSGFVGRHLIGLLRSAGHDARGLSRRPGEGSLEADLLDVTGLRRAIEAFAPEVIFHLAGVTNLKPRSADTFAVNVEGVANLLDVVRDAPSVRRVVWMSSQLVNRPGVRPATVEDCDPADPYGASKAEGEKLVRSRDGAGKEWVIVRSTTIWGPGMSDHYANVLRSIRRGRYAHIGRRPLVKSYSYVENLAAQLMSLATAAPSEVNRRTFYIADSDPIEIRQWLDQFAAIFGRRIPTIPVAVARAAATFGDFMARLGRPFPITSGRLTNLLTEYRHDVAPIEQVHGRTGISNEEGVRRTAAWLLARDDQRLEGAN